MKPLLTALKFTFLVLIFSNYAIAQSKITKEKMMNAYLNSKNELVITASSTSSLHDFDYLKGKWIMKHKKLKTRLNNSTEWEEFETTDENFGNMLNGLGNTDLLKANFDGKPFEGFTLRLFNPQTRLWSLYWVASDKGILDPPVIGSFDGNIGNFYGKDIYNGIPVIFTFRWNKSDPGRPVWSQAFSTDNGETWEWNWWNVSLRDADTTGGFAGDVFLPKIASSDSFDFGSHFSPDGNTFYFSRAINGKTKIFLSNKTGATWSTPAIAPFSNTDYADADPAFSPNGELYFISSRPRNKKDTTKDFDIWKVTPTGNGQWSAPINVKELNTDKNEFYISFAQNGNIYFSSSRVGGYGEEDIYVSINNKGKLSAPKNLGPAINTSAAEFDPFVTANESGLIFASSNRQDGFGKADLYWSVKKDDKWMGAKHFEKNINSSTRDFCPYISKDQKYFFYSSMGDIKKVSIEHLPREFTISL